MLFYTLRSTGANGGACQGNRILTAPMFGNKRICAVRLPSTALRGSDSAKKRSKVLNPVVISDHCRANTPTNKSENQNAIALRGLPARFGNWHTVYTRMNRWSKKGVLDRVFE